MRWGLLSTAAINEAILAGARAATDVEVVAVASRSVHHAQDYARRHGIPRAHGSYEALLDDPGVDAVYIPLPNGMHAEWTMRALEAGKHVLVEKPFTRCWEDARAAVEAAERAGLVLSEAFMWRHHPQTMRLRELVRSGAIGRLLLVRAAFCIDLAALRGEGDTRFDPALDGGAMMDLGCYCLSAIRLLAGEPERVSAERVDGPSGVDVVMAATLRMPDGVLAQLDCGFVSPHRTQLEVVGTEGSLVLDDPWHCRVPGIRVYRGPEPVSPVRVPSADSYRLQMENVSAAIRGDEPLRVAPADALGQARAIEAVYASADIGAAVVPVAPFPAVTAPGEGGGATTGGGSAPTPRPPAVRRA